MHFSIVTSLYYSAGFVEEFYTRVCSEVEKVSNKFEIIFVNDGSPDNSLEIVLSLHEKDPRVKILDLSRNFGHHRAILTGLANTKGSYVFLIDCDLEEEPELFSRFWEKMQQTDADVVFGVQERRKGGFFERFSGGVFWTLFPLLSSFPVPTNQLIARLMTRRYVDSLLEYREHEVFLAGLWAIIGFKQISLKVKKHFRGGSTYSLRKKIAQFVNAITSFSATPLVFIFYLGSLIVALSASYALWLIIRKIFFNEFLVGWPSLIVSIWLLGGVTIFCIGLIGIYLSKVFVEAKQRPRVIIRSVYDHQKQTQPGRKGLPSKVSDADTATDHPRPVRVRLSDHGQANFGDTKAD